MNKKGFNFNKLIGFNVFTITFWPATWLKSLGLYFLYKAWYIIFLLTKCYYSIKKTKTYFFLRFSSKNSFKSVLDSFSAKLLTKLTPGPVYAL